MEQREWLRALVRRLKGSQNPEQQLDRMIQEYGKEEDVFGLGVSADELQDITDELRREIRELKTEVQNHFRAYKKFVEKGEKLPEDSIAFEDAMLDAEDQLEAAQIKRNEWNEVSSIYQVLRRALMKWRRVKRREKRREQLGVSLQNFDLEDARRNIQELVEEGQLEQQRAEELKRDLDMLGEAPEPDLSDAKKDVQELEGKYSKDGHDWNGPDLSAQESEDSDDGEEKLTMEDLEDIDI